MKKQLRKKPSQNKLRKSNANRVMADIFRCFNALAVLAFFDDPQ
jgi:hypothetical protein